MSKAWTELSMYESVDLVKRSYKILHERQLNTERATEIVAHFSQGREYFLSAANAGPLVKPLLLYYGSLALSRGAILILDGTIRACGLIQGHGLGNENWQGTISKGMDKIAELPINAHAGTFLQLLEATGNSTNCFVHAGNTPYRNHYLSAEWPIPQGGTTVATIRQIVARLPQLHDLYMDVFDEFPHCYPAQVHVYKDSPGSVEIRFEKTRKGFPLPERLREDFSFLQEQDFQQEYAAKTSYGYLDSYLATAIPYLKESIEETQSPIDDKCLQTRIPCRDSFTEEKLPLMEIDDEYNQRHTYLVAPIDNHVFSKLALLFMLSYALGMLVRYYPTEWRSLAARGTGDRFSPLVGASIELIEEQYPSLILDELWGHHTSP
jgi:hypothetical protein